MRVLTTRWRRLQPAIAAVVLLGATLLPPLQHPQDRSASGGEPGSPSSPQQQQHDATLAVVLHIAARASVAFQAHSLAELLYKVSLSFNNKLPAHYSVYHASTLYEIGKLYHKKGQSELAEQSFRQALQYYEDPPKLQSRARAAILCQLGTLFLAKGNHVKAELYLKEANQIFINLQLTRDADYASILLSLGLIEQAYGRYIQSEPLFQQALQIHADTTGTSSRSYADALRCLGLLHQASGNLARAEGYFQQALRIFEATVGHRSHSYAVTLHAMGTLYHKMLEYPRAEQAFLGALQLKEQTVGPAHRDYAVTLGALGNLYLSQLDYVRAETFMLRALDVKISADGADSRNVAASLYTLGRLYQMKGDLGRAEIYYKRALSIRQKLHGTKNRFYAAALHALGWLYQARGRQDLAETHYRKVLQIYEGLLGRDHPVVSGVLDASASLRFLQGRSREGRALLRRAVQIAERSTERELRALPDSRRTSFSDVSNTQNDLLYSWLHTDSRNLPLRRLALSVVLLRKGRSLDEAANLSAAIYGTLSRDERRDYDRMRELLSRAANLSMNLADDLGAADGNAARLQLKELSQQAESIEQRLLLRSAPLRARQVPGLDEIVAAVAAALPKDGVLVEIIQYLPKDLRTLLPQSATEARYLALGLSPDGRIEAADLGLVREVDGMVQALLDASATPAIPAIEAAERASQYLLRPLLPLFRGKRRIFLAPDGQLSMLNFGSLRAEGRYLLGRYHFNYLTSGRDLLRYSVQIAPNQSVVALADPEFGRRSPADVTASGLRSMRLGLDLAPLAGTRREAESILKIWPHTQVLLGRDATDVALLNLQAPGILHVATHGFFDILRQIVQPTIERHADGVRSTWIRVEARPANPLLRSALVLARPQPEQWRQSFRSADLEQPDGLVTALEMAGMNLWGTQLVVLSACDTGRGDSHPGQGVYGLRRAVLAAGAETLVMSLWKVDDQATEELMTAFYTYLHRGLGRADALEQAALGVMQRYPHPHYWASFISLGRADPLRDMPGSALPLPLPH